MANLQTEPQTHMEEITLSDPALVATVNQWAEAHKKRKEYLKDIKDLMIDDLKEKVEDETGQDFNITDRPVTFRIPNTGITITVRPPGEPKEVEFTTKPKRSMRIKVEEEKED